MINTPVVFLVFNRPDLTARVFERIREARPRKLLVVSDGPRQHVASDNEGVETVRALVEDGIDWPCHFVTNYSPVNLGCRDRVASGLDWAFDQVNEAIILEDDCVPDPSFFNFCESLLGRFRNETKVMHIGGTNFSAKKKGVRTSYYFSKYPQIWGWASWRRAWREYDLELKSWTSPAAARAIEDSFDSNMERAFWLPTFEQIRKSFDNADTWDYSWIYSCWRCKGLAITPATNLIENIGLEGGGAHYAQKDRADLRVPANSITQLSHPRSLCRNKRADAITFQTWSGCKPESPLRKLASLLRGR